MAATFQVVTWRVLARAAAEENEDADVVVK